MRLQLAAQSRERRAQAHASGLRIGIRPEELDQVLSEMRSLAKVGQVSQQGSGLLGAKAGQRLISLLHAQAAQQLDGTRGVHRTLLQLGITDSISYQPGRVLPNSLPSKTKDSVRKAAM